MVYEQLTESTHSTYGISGLDESFNMLNPVDSEVTCMLGRRNEFPGGQSYSFLDSTDYQSLDIRAFLLYDKPLSSGDYTAIEDYVNSLPVDEWPRSYIPVEQSGPLVSKPGPYSPLPFTLPYSPWFQLLTTADMDKLGGIRPAAVSTRVYIVF